MKDSEKIPSLRDMEFGRFDQIFLQLQTISRELIFQNANSKKELLSERSVKEIYDLCPDGPTEREITEKTGRDKKRVKEVLDTLWQAGLVETFIDEQSETHFVETVPQRDRWWVFCRKDSRIYLTHHWPSQNDDACSGKIWGPFPSEPHARAFANAHFPGWRCDCPNPW